MYYTLKWYSWTKSIHISAEVQTLFCKFICQVNSMSTDYDIAVYILLYNDTEFCLNKVFSNQLKDSRSGTPSWKWFIISSKFHKHFMNNFIIWVWTFEQIWFTKFSINYELKHIYLRWFNWQLLGYQSANRSNIFDTTSRRVIQETTSLFFLSSVWKEQFQKTRRLSNKFKILVLSKCY